MLYEYADKNAERLVVNAPVALPPDRLIMRDADGKTWVVTVSTAGRLVVTASGDNTRRDQAD